MADDAASRQPISKLKKVMSKDVDLHRDTQASPELLDLQQREDLRLKKLLTKNAVPLIWLYALSAVVFVALDGLSIDWFGLSDMVLTAYIAVALGPPSAYLVRKFFTFGIGA